MPKTLAVGAVKEITGAWTPASAPGVAVTYASSKTSVAHIDKAGRIVAKAPGTTKITVKAGGKSKAYTLRVV
ncbi:MAG: Ig-like domain-containing protein [Bifidobacteriaceae bacterium]|nr:Ig-like domain-containing protein [Bifidobacteriaceae bacterium]